MKSAYLIVYFLLISSGLIAQESNLSSWNLDSAKHQANRFNSESEWDTLTLQKEIANLSSSAQRDYPLRKSPFPTPRYKSPGNGNGGINDTLSGKAFCRALCYRGT